MNSSRVRIFKISRNYVFKLIAFKICPRDFHFLVDEVDILFSIIPAIYN